MAISKCFSILNPCYSVESTAFSAIRRNPACCVQYLVVNKMLDFFVINPGAELIVRIFCQLFKPHNVESMSKIKLHIQWCASFQVSRSTSLSGFKFLNHLNIWQKILASFMLLVLSKLIELSVPSLFSNRFIKKIEEKRDQLLDKIIDNPMVKPT